jgi:hypothetical protein
MTKGSTVAGALFDFAGYLTTRNTVIHGGASEDAVPMVEALKEFAALRQLEIDWANVQTWQDDVRRDDELLRDLSSVINHHSRENVSNTPDWLLAKFLALALTSFEMATLARERWYGHGHEPGRMDGCEVPLPTEDSCATETAPAPAPEKGE